MKQNYLSAKKLSLWMSLTKRWKSLYSKAQSAADLNSLKKLNNLSLLLGVKRKLVLTALAGTSVLGLQAQVSFVEVTNRAEQTFITPLDLASRTSPTFEDIDSDGDLDLIVGDNDGIIRLFKNENSIFVEQTGADNPFDGIDVGADSKPTFADLDKDGDLDLITGRNDGDISFFENNNSIYTEQTSLNDPFDGINAGRNSTVTFEDLDEDGDLDLIVGNKDGIIQFFDNDNSVFTVQTGTNNPFDGIDVGYYSNPTFVDLDTDGDLDLIIGDKDGAIKFYSKESAGYIEKTGVDNPFGTIDVYTQAAPIFVDLDTDGDLDLIIGAQQGIRVFDNESNVFTEQKYLDNPFSSRYLSQGVSPEFVDLDKDGDLDLIVGNTLGDIIFLDNESNVFTDQIGNDNPFDNINVEYDAVPTFVDLDSDGDLDLILGEYYGSIRFYENESNIFTEQIGVDNPFSAIDVGDFSKPIFADLDSDGDLDLVIGAYDGTVKFFDNTANVFTEQTGVDNPFDGIDVGYNSSPIFADLDKDGDLDLFLGNNNSTILFFENEFNIFTEQTGIDNPLDGLDFERFPQATFADLDKDGDLDLFVGDHYGNITEYRNVSPIPTGLLDFAENEATLNIYPNPSSSIINTDEGALQIIDGLGNIVLETESAGIVDVSSLESGIYFVTQNGKRAKLIIE